MSLPDPPEAWLDANGYTGWLSGERRREARVAYAYEREHGPPPAPFPPGSIGAMQWEYRGEIDPRAAAKTTTTTRKEAR